MNYLNISNITELQNDYILENGMEYKGLHFISTEHALKHFKYNHNSDSNKEFLQLCLQKNNHGSDLRAYEFKNKTSLVVNPDYLEKRYDLVLELNKIKFGNYPKLAKILVATGSNTLVEITSSVDKYGLAWADTYWGFFSETANFESGEGENNMGKILMEVRDMLNG
ncbi:MAG: NADAR family protein [bacterium]